MGVSPTSTAHQQEKCAVERLPSPTNMAFVLRCLEDQIPLGRTPFRCHDSGSPSLRNGLPRSQYLEGDLEETASLSITVLEGWFGEGLPLRRVPLQASGSDVQDGGLSFFWLLVAGTWRRVA